MISSNFNPKKMKVIASIITYNPNIKRFIQNIEAILPQVTEIIIVDNASKGTKNSYTFDNVTENHSIKVVFKAQPVVKDIEIDSTSWNAFKKEYLCYEDLDDVTKLKIKVTYNEESGEPEKTIPVTADMVEHVSTEYVKPEFSWGDGIKDAYWKATFGITYGGKSTTFDVRVDCWVWPDIACDYCEHWDGKNGKTHDK